MISWHKPGQKVAARDCRSCPMRGLILIPNCTPHEVDQVFTISGVVCFLGVVGFWIKELQNGPYAAGCFKPVYPTIIDQLRKLDTPSPERVKEEA